MGKQREIVLKVIGHAGKDKGFIPSVCKGGHAPLWGRPPNGRHEGQKVAMQLFNKTTIKQLRPV